MSDAVKRQPNCAIPATGSLFGLQTQWGPNVTRTSHAASLMVQGTTSDAGKSVLVAGLCRLFRQRGIHVAPFKPQNMALNSAVTEDRGEIGRSQAVQAMACDVAPHSDMNPVLLKPNSDTGAQVIVQGQVLGNREAGEYANYKRQAMPYVMESFHRLAVKYELVVVEGAGSPAEINLRDNDIANMGFAMAAGCPVIIVADIDRGGVFAHLVGTLECLSREERSLVKGFVINRFRGDPALLASGLDWLTGRTGIPVLGVVPYLHGLHIEAEDAVNTFQPGGDQQALRFNVVVPRLPRISNHTDFDILRHHPGVNLVFAGVDQAIPACDLVILPGSKNTISDLQWLRHNHWPEYLQQHLRYGGKVLGICGGYQMLGQQIHDPDGIEGTPQSVPGLGLMPYQTTLLPGKQLRNVQGKLFGRDTVVRGYEIHMGATHMSEPMTPLLVLDDGREDGAVSDDNRIAVSYLHGLFDETGACDALLDWAGAKQQPEFDYQRFRRQQFNRLADTLSQHLDLGLLGEITGLPLAT